MNFNNLKPRNMFQNHYRFFLPKLNYNPDWDKERKLYSGQKNME